MPTLSGLVLNIGNPDGADFEEAGARNLSWLSIGKSSAPDTGLVLDVVGSAGFTGAVSADELSGLLEWSYIQNVPAFLTDEQIAAAFYPRDEADETFLTEVTIGYQTAAAWASANPVLAAGELGIESDTLQAKVGNGTDAWNDLPYGVLAADRWPMWDEVTEKPETFPPEGHGHDDLYVPRSVATAVAIWDGTAYPARPDAASVSFRGPDDPGPEGLDLMQEHDEWIDTSEAT